jgi:hypothetical protein
MTFEAGRFDLRMATSRVSMVGAAKKDTRTGFASGYPTGRAKVSRLSRLSAAARPLEKKPPPYRFSPSAVTAARCSTVVIGFTGLLLYLA